MLKSNLLYLAAGLLVGLLCGFSLANMVGRSRMERAQTPGGTARQDAGKSAGQAASAPANQPTPAITEEQIREAIAKTDSRPDDINLQQNFGRALYHYANQTQDPRYLPDVIRLLKRAQAANPKDRELTIDLANAYFDVGQTSDARSFDDARTYYLKALEMKPDDVNVRTDLGLTYYYARPSDPQRAIAEYRKSLRLAPRDERALESLATALISAGQREEAGRRIEELQGINPNNPSLSNLRAQLAQSENRPDQE